MKKSDYPEYYNILKEEMLDFLPNEEAKSDFLDSLFNWLCSTC